MTTGGQPVACDLICSLEASGTRSTGRMRRCSLARCFVETECALPAGREVRVEVTLPDLETRESLLAVVERARHETWIDEERVRGLEFRLLEIGPRFFAIYSGLCDALEGETTPSLSLPLEAERSDTPRDRRRAERNPWTLPVHVFGEEIDCICETRDVSATGAFVLSAAAPPKGAVLHLEFLGERSFFTAGTVARIESKASEAGREIAAGFAVHFLPHAELIRRAHAGYDPEQFRARTVAQARVAAEPPPAALTLELRIDTPEDLGTLFLKQIDKGALFVPGPCEAAPQTRVDVALHFGSGAPFWIRGQVVQRFDRPAGVGLQVLNGADAAEWFKACLRTPSF